MSCVQGLPDTVRSVYGPLRQVELVDPGRRVPDPGMDPGEGRHATILTVEKGDTLPLVSRRKYQ